MACRATAAAKEAQPFATSPSSSASNSPSGKTTVYPTRERQGSLPRLDTPTLGDGYGTYAQAPDGNSSEATARENLPDGGYDPSWLERRDEDEERHSSRRVGSRQTRKRPTATNKVHPGYVQLHGTPEGPSADPVV